MELRRWVLDRDRVQATMWWAALCAGAGVVYLVLADLWAAAVVLGGLTAGLGWLSGAWLLLSPSIRTYLTRVTRRWENWVARTLESDAQLATARGDLARKVSELDFAGPVAPVHDQLVRQLEAVARLSSDQGQPVDARTRIAIEEWRQVRRTFERLVKRADLEGQRQSANQVSEHFRAYDVARASAHDAASNATHDLMCWLAQIRVPRAVAAEHAQLIEALDHYGERLRTWTEQADATSEADVLVQDLFGAQAQVMRAAEAINGRVQERARIPR